ncbi:MAG: hypothetical protein JOZ54_25420 [Acidobacteria bacterium]|nr:hypothetical protein [Acidobacteriota bacterium]
MKKLASSLFLVVLLLAPVAAPASAAATHDRDGGVITKISRFVKSFLGGHTLGDWMTPPLP